MAPPPASVASAATLSGIALASKAFLTLSTQEYKVHGMEHLMRALRGESNPLRGDGEKREIMREGSLPRRGIVTVCNHNSVVDDPMMWAALPISTFFPFARASHTCHNLRWTLGAVQSESSCPALVTSQIAPCPPLLNFLLTPASDIMFTSPPLSKFFTLGQVIETVRGGGIYQPAVDTAIKRVETGGWIHIFPEGKVNQTKSNPSGGLHRFKWGVGRIIMDSSVMPEVIPMWISGFDQIMNEHRGAPRFVPRPGAKISVTVGEPITGRVQPLVEAFKRGRDEGTGDDDPTKTRIKVVDVLQDAVRRLGEAVEHREGRFETGQWSQSRPRSQVEASRPAPTPIHQ